ncbi:hypothetical protein F5B22DRAFT_71021 [Xylaria bambusicola]|uniref:uncharacterized protein n=1 Tax=Xylaria bambusicola TaxID=326684 RepID=UPI0020080A3B|nr:uncharacterized protein F5B22DRAFT_71021 [Xylaria bambusicola]KAI0518565.1 hypothetical protein F5B22DRAFT_71021 [Xylaria bambusicola]
MGTLSHVLHRGARPISVREFADALRAISPPRFPTLGGNSGREVGIAVSGGVDSMALAYLCSHLKSHDRSFHIADNPLTKFRALIVNHRLREGSGEEADAVARAVQDMGMPSDVFPISWLKTGLLGQQGQQPNDLPNLESVARKARYRKLGAMCAFRHYASLLLAHHEDDQYETILMRLLQGHGVRGLRGMKTAQDIPECERVHGARHSGYVDDQRRPKPRYNFSIIRNDAERLRQELRASIDHQMNEQELRQSILDGIDHDDFEKYYQIQLAVSLALSGIDVENGGVMVYRPLLGFPKDRLVATCEANNIPWWEDSTNDDQTLTMRNAVRHMYKNYTLPVALQKPSILALSRRCDQEARALQAEADRLMAQTRILDIVSHIGTASVQFPDYGMSCFPRDKARPLRRRARILRQREVAGLLIRRILEIVTPEEHPIPLANLQNVISRLFPTLSDSPKGQSIPELPKAFVIAGVHFLPIDPVSLSPTQGIPPSQSANQPQAWYLSRTPYPSKRPVPHHRFTYWSIPRHIFGKYTFNPADTTWSRWLPWALWDGRFWVCVRHRLPYRVILQPFALSHAKAFRESLAPADRDRLAAVLKRSAPGKTRYTLPALYLEEHLDLEDMHVRRYYPESPAGLLRYAGDTAALEADPSISDHPRVIDVSKMRLIALPSLDIRIPKLDEWLEYQIRYRRVDPETLEKAAGAKRDCSSFVSGRTLRAGSKDVHGGFRRKGGIIRTKDRKGRRK